VGGKSSYKRLLEIKVGEKVSLESLSSAAARIWEKRNDGQMHGVQKAALKNLSKHGRKVLN